MRRYKWFGGSADGLPHLKHWRESMRARPVWQRGVAVSQRLVKMEQDKEAAKEFATNAQNMVQS